MTTGCEYELASRAKSLKKYGSSRATIDVLEPALIKVPDACPLWRLRIVRDNDTQGTDEEAGE